SVGHAMLPGRLRMAEATAAAGPGPGCLGPAASSATNLEARAADGDRSRSRGRPLRAIAGIAGADGDRDVVPGIVRVILGIGRRVRVPVAVRDRLHARLGLGVIDACPESRE